MFCATELPHPLLLSVTLLFQLSRAALSTTTVTLVSSIALIACTPQPLAVLHYALKNSDGSMLRRVKLRHCSVHRFPSQLLYSCQLQLIQHRAFPHLVLKIHFSISKPLQTFVFRALLKHSRLNIFYPFCYHLVHGLPRKLL